MPGAKSFRGLPRGPKLETGGPKLPGNFVGAPFAERTFGERPTSKTDNRAYRRRALESQAGEVLEACSTTSTVRSLACPPKVECVGKGKSPACKEAIFPSSTEHTRPQTPTVVVLEQHNLLQLTSPLNICQRSSKNRWDILEFVLSPRRPSIPFHADDSQESSFLGLDFDCSSPVTRHSISLYPVSLYRVSRGLGKDKKSAEKLMVRSTRAPIYGLDELVLGQFNQIVATKK